MCIHSFLIQWNKKYWFSLNYYYATIQLCICFYLWDLCMCVYSSLCVCYVWKKNLIQLHSSFALRWWSVEIGRLNISLKFWMKYGIKTKSLLKYCEELLCEVIIRAFSCGILIFDHILNLENSVLIDLCATSLIEKFPTANLSFKVIAVYHHCLYFHECFSNETTVHKNWQNRLSSFLIWKQNYRSFLTSFSKICWNNKIKICAALIFANIVMI